MARRNAQLIEGEGQISHGRPWGLLQLSGRTPKGKPCGLNASGAARGQQARQNPPQLRPVACPCKDPPVQPGDAALLFASAVIHSVAVRAPARRGRSGLAPGPGAAVFRPRLSIPMRPWLVIGYCLRPRLRTACGSGTLQASGRLIPLIWIGTAISFFFLYPAPTTCWRSRRLLNH